MNKIFIGKWIKKRGKLLFKHKTEEKLFDMLLEKMREGQVVDFYVDFSDDLGHLSQIAKLKAGIRELAHQTGHQNIEIQNEIKKSAGLYNEHSKEYKSFSNCSIEELSGAIQVMIEFGTVAGVNLK